MDLQHGILLFVIGNTLTVLGFFLVFYFYGKHREKLKRIKEEQDKSILKNIGIENDR
jgi:hypothetical protein